MSDDFKELVISKLDSIESRLCVIEEKVDDATSFAGSVLGEDGSIPADGLEALKSTFSTLLNPQTLSPEVAGGFGAEGSQNPESIGDLVSSLKNFQDRLASVREAMADLPNEDEE